MADPTFCRDRYGMFPPEVFKLFTCTMCYSYLFHLKGQLTPNMTSQTDLVPKNPQGPYPKGTYIKADVDDDDAVRTVCSTLNAEDCSRWTRCCEAAIRCCDRQLHEPLRNTTELFCPRTWDGFGCFGDTDTSERVYIHCPLYVEYASPWEYAYKDCTENGTWYKNPLTKSEWTNYTGCIITEDYSTVLYVSFACNIFTILLLIPACIIFLRIRQLLAQKRIRLHLSLFVSLLLSCVVDILWDFIVYKDRLEHEKELTIMHENSVGCRLLYSLTRYFNTANIIWMFCEGYYLHRLIVHAFEAPGSLMPYYLSGWAPMTFYLRHSSVELDRFLPWRADGDGYRYISSHLTSALSSVPVTIYAAVRASDERYNVDCWVFHAENLEWIIYVPNLICIGANLVFLVNILRILLTQIQTHPNEPSNYRKAMKAMFLLIPLFGLQQFVVIYRPGENSAEFAYEIIASILQNTKGAVVALIFCFFNGEVLGHLKGALRKKWNTRSLRSTYTEKGSIYSKQYERRGMKTNEVTPMYIPMSPSATTKEDPCCSTPFTNGHTKKSNSLEECDNEL